LLATLQQREVQTRIRDPIARMLDLYKGPQAVIQKRSKKLIDYDLVRAMRARNDKVGQHTLS
jgi:hypothetical protein